LNKLAGRNGDLQVLSIIHAKAQDARQWADETGARFPVLVQEDWNTSKCYEAFATPFAFLIDEDGVIASKGIVSNKQHIGFVLDAAEKHQTERQPAQEQADGGDQEGSALAGEQSGHEAVAMER